MNKEINVVVGFNNDGKWATYGNDFGINSNEDSVDNHIQSVLSIIGDAKDGSKPVCEVFKAKLTTGIKPQLLLVPNWIDAKVILPSDTRPVLVVHELNVSSGRHLLHGITAYMGEHKRWCKDWKVLYWMELPLLPENLKQG